MTDLLINVEPLDFSGALSLFHAAVDELARRYGPGADDRASMIDDLREPGGFFLVARREGHLVGGVGVRTLGDPAQGRGEIKRLWVRPDQRRTGVAVALMHAALVEARRRHLREIYLETGDRQPEARSFYDATGWTPIDDFPDGAVSHPGAFRYMKTL